MGRPFLFVGPVLLEDMIWGLRQMLMSAERTIVLEKFLN